MASGSDGDNSIQNVSFDSLTETLISLSLQAPPPLPTLSLDCIAEILSRLPLKLLFQLRCQGKFFNSLFSNPNFAKQHLRYSTKCHHLMVSSYYRGKLLIFDSHPIASDFSTSTLANTQISYPNCFKVSYPNCFKIGYFASSSCDGILCLTMCKSYAAILWNPSLRTFKRLPPLDNNPPSSISIYSFGYDHFIHNYKVVAMTFFVDKRKIRCKVNVLTLGIDSWRRIQDFPYSGEFCGLGIFMGATVNWLPFDNVSSLPVIVSLDLKKESYQEIPQPDLENNHYTLTLGALKDYLCIYANSGNNMFLDVWIMKEYGNKASWTKLYCVPHMGNWGLCQYSMISYISENDQLLMDFYENGKSKLKLVFYDFKNGIDSWRRIQDFPYSGAFCGLGIFVGGTVNWLPPSDNVSSLPVIVSLDLKKESYQQILQPDLENSHYTLTLGALKDYLCIYANSGNNMFLDVWIMKEYGNKASWTKLYCVPHMGNWGLCQYSMISYISENDQLLMGFYENGKSKLKLVFYDFKNGTFMVPKIQNLYREMTT